MIDGAAKQCRLYLDGDLKKTIPYKGKRLMKPGQALRIGCSSGDEFMDGVIDEVKIWSCPPVRRPGAVGGEPVMHGPAVV